MIGRSLSHYRITAKLGEGGMGAVYRAEDTSLGREVAIKVLPEAVAGDAERLARFEREAKVLAALNHPAIAAIHAFERSGDPPIHFLVMELVAGETLAERLDRGPVPLVESLPIAGQIAEALEAAHEQGIVHRDLKPANVKVDLEGRVKVLDFGLAKALAPTSDAALDPTLSPTLTAMTAHQGVILGTAAYMSPEQARGRPADRRSDIWAFGVVLYEMLAGRRLFDGETVSDTLAAVLTRAPDWSALPAATPPAIRDLLRHCLRQAPRERLQAIGDARLVIDEVMTGREAVAGPPAEAVPRAPSRARSLTLGLAAAGLVLAGVALDRWLAPAPAAPEPILATLEFPKGLALDGEIALSADGRQLVVSAWDPQEQVRRLYLRTLSRLEVRPLAGTEDATYPFWSPDGRSIGFFAEGKLKRVDLPDGIVRTVADAPAGRGGAWSRHGLIVFAPGAGGGLVQVAVAGGAPAPLTSPASAGVTDRLPHLLPDGRSVLFVSAGHPDPREDGVYLVGPQKGAPRQLLPLASETRYASPGYLVFVREGNLMAQPFDAEGLRTTGEPAPLATGLQFQPARYSANFALSETGRLVYQSRLPLPARQLAWFDLENHRLEAIGDPLPIWDLAVSPDARQAVVIWGEVPGDYRVSLLDLERGVAAPFAADLGFIVEAAWSSDGRFIALGGFVGSSGIISIRDAGGSLDARTVLSGEGMEYLVSDWSPDGRELLVSALSLRDKRPDLVLVPAEGGSEVRPLVSGPAEEWDGSFSPDGRLVAFHSDETGEAETYVVSTSSPGRRWRITRGGARTHAWLSERELLFVARDGGVWTVGVTWTSEGLEIAAPRSTFGGRKLLEEEGLWYARGAQRLLVAEPAETPQSSSLVLVSDWLAALRRD